MKGNRWLYSENRCRFLFGIICLAFLVILPLLIESRVSYTERYYSELLRAHECVSEICAVDFDSDGILGRVFIDRSSSTAPHQYWLVVKENGKELIRLPFWELDTNSRTRAATNQSYATGQTQLLLYERKGRNAPTINAVYVWTGKEMTQIPPSPAEQDLFAAMAARDVNGAFPCWVLYRLLRVPTLVGYYVILTFLAVVLAEKSRRS